MPHTTYRAKEESIKQIFNFAPIFVLSKKENMANNKNSIEIDVNEFVLLLLLCVSCMLLCDYDCM